MSLFDIGISVVVLTKNNEDTIGTCLKSILLQDYAKREVIVIDGNSTDDTRDIVASWGVKIYDGGNIGESRQLGVEKSKYDLVAFVDSDCELPCKNWLSSMVAPFENKKNINLAATFAMGAYRKEYPAIARYDILNFWSTKPFIPLIVTDKVYFPVGCAHVVFKKSVINAIGGFKPLRAGEDIDLTKRICEAGYDLWYQKLPVYHLHAKTLKQYISKYKRDISSTLVTEGEKPNYLKFVVNKALLPVPVTLLGLLNDRDLAWLWHPVISYYKCFIALRSLIKFRVCR